MPEPPFVHSGEITTSVNPAGTYLVTLEPMPLRGALCEQGFLALSALLVTQQYRYIWGRNAPEVVYFRVWSGEAKTFGTALTLQLPEGAELHATVTSRAIGTGLCRSFVWEHSLTLTRDEFLAISRAGSVGFRQNGDMILLSSENLQALRDLASRMEPESSLANPPDPDVLGFAGDLDVSMTYHASLSRQGARGWWPVDPIRLPRHHAIHIEWTNLDEFPLLGEKTAVQRQVVFQVMERSVTQMTANRWNTLVKCKILKVW